MGEAFSCRGGRGDPPCRDRREMNISNGIALGALFLSVLTAFVTATAVIVQMRGSVARLIERDKSQDVREEALKTFIAQQGVINETTAAALETVARKLEDVQKSTNESSTIVSLLTEVLRKKAPAGIIDG